MSESRENRQTYLGVGVAFLGLAVALGITMDSWAFALPFIAIAVTFLGLGAKKPRGTESKEDAAG